MKFKLIEVMWKNSELSLGLNYKKFTIPSRKSILKSIFGKYKEKNSMNNLSNIIICFAYHIAL